MLPANRYAYIIIFYPLEQGLCAAGRYTQGLSGVFGKNK